MTRIKIDTRRSHKQNTQKWRNRSAMRPFMSFPHAAVSRTASCALPAYPISPISHTPCPMSHLFILTTMSGLRRYRGAWCVSRRNVSHSRQYMPCKAWMKLEIRFKPFSLGFGPLGIRVGETNPWRCAALRLMRVTAPYQSPISPPNSAPLLLSCIPLYLKRAGRLHRDMS